MRIYFHIPSLQRVAATVVMTVVVVMQVAAQDDTSIVNTRWSLDATQIAGIDTQGVLHIWDGRNGDLIKQFDVYDEGVAEISWSPDASQIAVATRKDFTVRIWDIETEKLAQTLEVVPSPDEGMSVEWQPNGNLLAAVAFGENESLAIWEKTTQGFQIIEVETKASLAYDLRWSPDGQKLALADFAGIKVFKNFANVPIKAEWINAQTTYWFVWSPDSTKIISLLSTSYIGWNPYLQVIDVQTGDALMVLPEGEEFLGDLSWNMNSDQITTRDEDGVYHVWDVASQKIVDSFTLDEEIAPFVTASPYGGRFVIPPSTDEAPVEIIVPFASIERVQGIAKRCLADTDNLTSAVTAVLNDVVINSLTELTLPAFVSAVEALPTGAIPIACSADLVAVADAVIAEK